MELMGKSAKTGALGVQPVDIPDRRILRCHDF